MASASIWDDAKRWRTLLNTDMELWREAMCWRIATARVEGWGESVHMAALAVLQMNDTEFSQAVRNYLIINPETSAGPKNEHAND